MNQTFSHPLWKRLVTVDDEGIHEHRQGRLFASIRWEELVRLGREGVCSARGTRIALRLTPEQRREFVDSASEMWRQRHAERWQRNRARLRRSADWAAYFWFPLLLLGPWVAFQLWFRSLGSPDYLLPHLQKMNRISIAAAVLVLVIAAWHAWASRKSA
ncbi:MAG: hypothetical protein ACO1TE_19500 [Prosthecobacter sp.]